MNLNPLDWIRRARDWYRKRKRAVYLGGRRPRYYHDPVTDDVWWADSRYSTYIYEPLERGAEDVVGMLDTVHFAHLEVDPDYPEGVEA
jgi:hypothetical protein